MESRLLWLLAVALCRSRMLSRGDFLLTHRISALERDLETT